MNRERIIVAVECDFAGYQPYGQGCKYDHNQSVAAVSSAIDLISEVCGGKAVYFAHTSPFIRREHHDPFYTRDDYLELWGKAQSVGGEVGLHPHEEEPDGSCYYYYYSSHMSKVISEHAETLRSNGINVQSQIMGYFGMNEWIVPIVEDLGLYVSLNNVGKYVRQSHSDWRPAGITPFFHSYDNISVPGDTRVLEIPLGMTSLMRYEDGLIVDTNSLWDLKRIWKCRQEEGILSPCFVLLRTEAWSRCEPRARKFLTYLFKQGVDFSLPAEVYNYQQ